MFGFGKSKKKEEETIDLVDLYKKNQEAYSSDEMKASLKELSDFTEQIERENKENAKKYKEEYEQGLIDWELYNIARKGTGRDALNVDCETDAKLRQMGKDYQQGIISREQFIKELEKYNVNDWDEYNLYTYTADELAKILQLNKTLRGEMMIVLKYSKDNDLKLYDLEDVKATLTYLLNGDNDWLTKPYGFIKANLTAILRQVTLAELSKNDTASSYDFSAGETIYFEGILTGEDFENFCAKLLKRRGYTDVSLTPGSGDHGIDILADKDDVSYAIQCKYYSTPVGNSAIQEAFSGKKLYHRDIAVVMTNSTFTPQAINDAGELGVKLWDGTKIEKWISELQN